MRNGKNYNKSVYAKKEREENTFRSHLTEMKMKLFFVSLFLRSESEIQIPRGRDQEVKF